MMAGAEEVIHYQPVLRSGSEQDSLPGRYRKSLQWLSMAAFTFAFAGWLNESWFYWFESPIWLNRYTEYAIILGFGVWRIWSEKNPYTRKRLTVLVAVVTLFWWLIPWLVPRFEPYVGYLWNQPIFPSIHVPGTITFFLILGLVTLFGRRVVCGWGCPCVGIRETVGYAFRDRTIRGKWAHRLRHSKWFFFVIYMGVLVATLFPPSAWTVTFVGLFYAMVGLTYFGTFFLMPAVGNRFYCRYLCPYGATFGLLNHAGFYGIDMEQEQCNDCRRCEQVCDMGIRVWEEGKAEGRVTDLEDCMGCGRCVVSCPTNALEFRDIRNLFRTELKQNGDYLLKQTRQTPPPRILPKLLPAGERIGNWSEIEMGQQHEQRLAWIEQQASRCLNCGLPGCRNSCPLSNRIPEWLGLAASGRIPEAAAVIHQTNPLPEVCGRLCPQNRLCEGGCTLAQEEQGAVAIGALERTITDLALERSIRIYPEKRESVRLRGKSIAVVGGGPAGLACADFLARAGCAVSLHDREREIGGLLLTGVPSFKLDKSILARRRMMLEEMGVTFHLGEQLAPERIVELAHTADALFLGTGAQTPRSVALAGQELEGVFDALSYLRHADPRSDHSSQREIEGRHVVVLGGGDTAMDCARTAVRQRAAAVTVVCRKAEEEIRATPKEVQAAREEGVRFLYLRTQTEIVGEGGRVKGVKLMSLSIEEDGLCGDPGIGISGLEEIVACDVAILAFGQVREEAPWLERLQQENSRVFTGGDLSRGPDLVVTAIADGRRAAEEIMEQL